MSKCGDVNSVIIVAGGQGKRFGSKLPKQFLPVRGKDNALKISIEKFQRTKLYSEIIVVLPPEYLQTVKMSPEIKVTSGGKFRAESVINGLKMLNPEAKLVAIHDAVRPLIDEKIIRQATITCKKFGAVVVGKIARDTVKLLLDNQQIVKTLDRQKIFLAQTPQIFSRDLIVTAYQKLKPELYSEITDDAQVVEFIFPQQKIIALPHTTYNEKITIPADLLLAKFLLKQEKLL